MEPDEFEDDDYADWGEGDDLTDAEWDEIFESISQEFDRKGCVLIEGPAW